MLKSKLWPFLVPIVQTQQHILKFGPSILKTNNCYLVRKAVSYFTLAVTKSLSLPTNIPYTPSLPLSLSLSLIHTPVGLGYVCVGAVSKHNKYHSQCK